LAWIMIIHGLATKAETYLAVNAELVSKERRHLMEFYFADAGGAKIT
jgi:hypothetical protein